MRAVKFFLCSTFVFLLFANISFAGEEKKEVYVKGELLVKFKNGTASAASRTAHSRMKSVLLEEFPDLGWQRVKISDDLSVEAASARYAKFADVESVQPNYYYHLLAIPNDPRYPELYGLPKISAPAAWDLTTGSANTVVAVIDTGVNYNHQDLAANMWTNSGEIPGNGIDDDGNGFVDDYYGYDFFFNVSNPLDQNGHGTHVAGTIGAVGNNGIGVVGVNWNVRLMAIKIYNSSGFGTTSTMLINAYNYVRLMKNRGVNIRVTNNSYGGCDEACGYDQATKDAIDALGSVGILNVFAAGNNGQNIETTPFYPASYTSPSILSVAASTSTDTKAGFSNFGAVSVDVAAPGQNILSTHNSSNTSYATLSGTSMATPHAAGAAALLSSYNPNLSAASLKATLMNTVDVLANWNGVVKTGGRINVFNALQNQTICNFQLSQNLFNANVGGGDFSVAVTAAANCDRAAESNVSWISITSGALGTGSGTVTFSVRPNEGAARTGTIRIGDTTLTVTQAGVSAAGNTVLDFDGDGRTDYSAIQNSGGMMIWHNLQSTDGYKAFNFGLFNGDVPVPADYDGDGKTDIAVWRAGNGTFYVWRSSNNTFQGFAFGQAGDNPKITQDFDGDRKADFAVARPVNGGLVWYIFGTNTGFYGVQFGFDTDKPVRGDFDGDGKADLAIYRPNGAVSGSNTFFVRNSSNSEWMVLPFGTSETDILVPADYDGDGKTDFAVWRSTNGFWYYRKSSDGSFNAAQFGAPNDLPTPGDYDGDGKTDFAVWRPNAAQTDAGIFYVLNSSSGFTALGWGNSQMKIPANIILNE